ncbi:hypothetical protein EDB80DRAFT_881943 [Ilyonectria destructans]|nr:hypothetical protein EDB80DRAFT_881943 [Ilyonectria destructans]
MRPKCQPRRERFCLSNDAEVTKRDISSAEDLINTLQDTVSSVKTQGGSLHDISDKVQSGHLSQDKDAGQALPELNSLLDTLTNFVTELIGSAGLDVTHSNVKTIHTLVVALVSEVTTIVKGLLTIFGPHLGAIVSGLVAALSLLLVGIGNGLLPPLLTLAAGLLAGLTA